MILRYQAGIIGNSITEMKAVFLKKSSLNSVIYTTNNQNGTVAIRNGIRLPKAGIVKAALHRLQDESWAIKSATVSQDSDDRYYVSVLFEYEVEVLPVQAAKKKHVGAGLQGFLPVRGFGRQYRRHAEVLQADAKEAGAPAAETVKALWLPERGKEIC